MTMAMRRIGRVMIGVHDSEPPTEAEWTRWVMLGRCSAERELRVLVETRGQGGPNGKQRREFADALARLDLRCAIISDSLIVRGVVTAVAWLGVALRAFQPGDHQRAADYLGLTDAELASALAAFVDLRRECNLHNSIAHHAG
jgi:hypothetical protein